MDSFVNHQVIFCLNHRQVSDLILIFFFFLSDKEYSHFVIQRVDMNLNESLYELNSLLAMCDLEEKITNVDGYEDLCQKELNSEKCCKPWSLPNYIALLANKTSCFQIEVSKFTELIYVCDKCLLKS